MSVSSVGSSASVGFHGQQVNLDQALQETVDKLIRHMNRIQFELRQLAAAVEQDLPFEEELKMSGQINDELRRMEWLFQDLRAMQDDLISTPDTPEDKLLLKKYKLDQKALEKSEQAKHAEEFRAERAAAKLAKKAALMSIGEDSEMKVD